MGIQSFLKHIKVTPAGNPSKKDVLRFLTFVILAYKVYYNKDEGTVVFRIDTPIHKKILFVDLKASHYFTFEKLDDSTYRFKLPKALGQNFLDKQGNFVIKKKALRFMTKPLIEELFSYYEFKKLKDIDRTLTHYGYSNTSIKVFKQTCYEFIPLHQVYTKDVTIGMHYVSLISSKWILSKPWLIEKMLKRKLSHRYPEVDFYIKDNKIIIESESITGKALVELLA